MADTLALEKLYADVVARFTADGTVAEQPFGWRVPAQQHIGPRIVWIPGGPTGSAGKTGAPKYPGGNPRSLATFRELFTVEISAQDPNAPEDELAQYKVTRLLRDAWYRAAYLAAHGTFAIESEDWIVEKKERRFGTAMRIVCSIDSKVPDQVFESAPVDSVAVTALSELDVTETQTDPAPLP